MNAAGDSTVPISDGLLLGVASGVFGKEESQWRPIIEELIERGIMRGDQIDVHGILKETQWEEESDKEPFGLFEPVPTGDGVSSMRLADVNGKHEWVAGFTTSTGFEYGMYSQNQLSVFHACGGLILDQPVECLSSDECELVEKINEHEACNHISWSASSK